MREPKNPSPDNSVAICKLIEACDQCSCLGDDAFRHAFNSAINALRASNLHVTEISQAASIAYIRDGYMGKFVVEASAGLDPEALQDLQKR